MSRRLNRKGQGLVEYILVIALMGVLTITAINKLGSTTQKGFNTASTKLQTEFSKM